MSRKKRWTSHRKLKSSLMKDSRFRREYESLEPEFQVARAIIEARIKNKVTQSELAKKADTDQAVISRLENMSGKPSISLLQRVAEALNMNLEIRLSPR